MAAYNAMLRIMNEKIDDMMAPAEQINWTPNEPPGVRNRGGSGRRRGEEEAWTIYYQVWSAIDRA